MKRQGQHIKSMNLFCTSCSSIHLQGSSSFRAMGEDPHRSTCPQPGVGHVKMEQDPVVLAAHAPMSSACLLSVENLVKE